MLYSWATPFKFSKSTNFLKLLKWFYNTYSKSLLVSDIKKMAMSSLSIYKDLHDYLNHVAIDNFSFTAAGEKQLSCSSEQEIGQRIKGQL